MVNFLIIAHIAQKVNTYIINFQKTCASVLRDNSRRSSHISVTYIALNFAGSRMWFVFGIDPARAYEQWQKLGVKCLDSPSLVFEASSFEPLDSFIRTIDKANSGN